MNILIRSTLRKRGPKTAGIKRTIRKLLSSLGRPDAEVGVLLVGDRAMRSLNRAWRGKDRTTDVLSFPLCEGECPPPAPGLLGDIVVCVPAARRQAAQAGHSTARELDLLLVHGLLHLLGYDHERGEAGALRMQRKERRLLEGLAR